MARKARHRESGRKKPSAAPSAGAESVRAPRRQSGDIALSPGPAWWRLALTAAAAFYIGAVFIEGSGGHLDRIVYRPILYFCQIAALFPRAATHRIEYRAEGLPCDGPAFEVDVRPFFPMHADDKESRFDRALHFYRNDRPTMEALEKYVMSAYNRSNPDKIAGLVLLSLRVPIPSPGSSFPRYARAPLADFPAEQRKVWYATSRHVVDRRCKGSDP